MPLDFTLQAFSSADLSPLISTSAMSLRRIQICAKRVLEKELCFYDSNDFSK